MAALAAAILVVGFAVGVILRIYSSKQPVNTATVYAGYLAALTIAVTLVMAVGAWWSKGHRGAEVNTPEQTAKAADRLADLMTARWRQEATLRRIVTPAPVTIRWQWAAEEIGAPRIEVATSPAPGTGPPPLPGVEAGELLGSGMVAHLHDDVYARLPHGRLVLLGGPGAGKTGAMILLLLAALDRRASLSYEHRSKVPVPVWLTLGGWNPVITPLEQWAVTTMNRDYPALLAADYGPDAAFELLRCGRVALFLDGLDEMPEGLRGRALRRLDDEGQGLRVVVTSRPEQYRGAVQVMGPGNTAVVELCPVSPDAAAAFLEHGQTGLSRRRWGEVGNYMRCSPESVIARALDNPLTLSLARDSYSTQDPRVLAVPGRFTNVDAVRVHLIDQLLITAYPDERHRERITSWLAWIARHMGTSRDLPWWQIPTWIPHWKLHIARGLAVGLVVATTAAFAAAHVVGLVAGHVKGPTATIVAGLMFGIGAGVVAEITAGARRAWNSITAIFAWLVFGAKDSIVNDLKAGLRHPPRALVPRWPRMREIGHVLRVGLGVGLMIAFGVGAVAAVAVGLAFASATRVVSGFTTGLAVGFVFGLVVGLVLGVRGLWWTPVASSPSASAIGTYRADRRTAVITGVMVGLAGGLTAGLAAGFEFGPMFGFETAVVFGLAAGLAIGPITAQVPLMKMAEVVLICQGSGRVNFARLLEDALSRQVLRQAGAVYQFRHAALQDYLAAMNSQQPIP